MFKLNKVELLGFKSFADRTRLEFGAGTAAIVGPNGCGKSNLGDAINWVLGEQSPKTLRGDRMADLIFNGTRLRPATSMAEVSLTLIDLSAEETRPVRSSRGSNGSAAPSGSNRGAADHHHRPSFGSAAGAAGNGHGHEADQNDLNGENGVPSRLTYRDSEIVITRRLFRSGESEYLINGDTCRLRDIQELFMGTGLGPDSYAIIEQGRIGQILSSKPSDRRAIIEEAAGVSKFRTRKRLAEAKLESARLNLARVTDILEEISKQVGSLKRQASKARRHRELTEELGSRLKLALTSRFLLLDAQCAKIRQDLSALQMACAEAGRELEGLDESEKTAAERLEQLESELVRLREACAQADVERERLASRLDQTRQQIAALERRRTEADVERAGLATELLELEHKAAERSQHAEEVKNEAVRAGQAVSQALARQAELAGALREAERRLESGRHGLLSAVAKAAELRNQLVQTGETAAALDRQAARTESERTAATQESLRLASDLETCRTGRASADEALSTVAGAAQDASIRLDQLRQEEAAERTRVEGLREDLSEVRARREALGESLARHAYSTESVRRLLSGTIGSGGDGDGAKNGSFKPLGVLADFLEVTPGYEEVVEEFLKQELDCVVVERHEDARRGLELLHTEGAGRSTFFVTRVRSNGQGHGASTGEPVPGAVARLADLVRFEPGLGLNGDLGLQSLAQAYVVEDAATAERLASEYPAHHFLTPRGEHYYHRLVSGGKGPSAGPLALRRDFRELDRRMTELEPVLASSRAELGEMSSHRANLEEDVRRLSTARVESEKDSLRLSERLHQAEQALDRSRQGLAVLKGELGRLTDESEKLRERRTAIERELEAASDEKALREAEIAQAGETTRQLRGESDRLAQELGEAQARRSALEERSQAAQAERLELESRVTERKSRLARLQEQCEAWSQEQGALAEEIGRLSARSEALEAEQDQMRARVASLVEESKLARHHRDELGPAVESARSRLEAEREKRSACEVALARAESDLDHHVSLCREELGREPLDLAAELPRESALAAERLEEAETAVRELKRKIAGLGPINMMALEELQEAEQRLTFLETQRQDLLASIGDTSQAIREIDEVSRRQFLEAFQAINANFAETFRTLFGGGVGAMRLSDEADPDSGIDLAAQPPGKRLQNVLLLSGGEKALVALALLIAIFRYTPSPFCILDEVDAPLDDSNVDRFTRMIEAMSLHTQFILMTHNKRTMEICPLMYGVTMEEPGVSKLVSVRFETPEHEKLAVAASF
ncbi:MAG TPA: chromosome segregation protein SMC [Terriglobia bacterium]